MPMFNPFKTLKLEQAIGGLLGTSGGAAGTGFKAPGTVPIQQGTTDAQIGDSYTNNQQALRSQQSLLNALKNQNGLNQQSSAYGNQQASAAGLTSNGGIGNQNQVYQQSQNLAGQLGNANGVGNLSGALASQQALAGQQQDLASQYANVAAGRGYNPALAALNQATGQNVANQSALMAGQRGAGSNVGLIARQAAQQGAATQQGAVGQAANTQAQQSIAALSGMAGQQQAIGQTNTNIGNISAQQIAQQQAQQQALAGQANTQIGNQLSAQQAASNQANILASQRIGATSANTQAQQAEQGTLQNALSSQNAQNVGIQSNVNTANSGLAQTTMGGQKSVIGGLAQSAGAAFGGARGGEVQKRTPIKMADGGGAWSDGEYIEAPQSQNSAMAPIAAPAAPVVQAPVAPSVQAPTNGAQSSIGKYLKSAARSIGGSQTPNGQQPQATGFNMAGDNKDDQALQQGVGGLGKGIVNRVNAPSTTTASPQDAMSGPDPAPNAGYLADPDTLGVLAAAKGGLANGGGKVDVKKPSQKAEKRGNSYDNDKIPAYLSEGEVVIPRSVMQSKDPARGAADFVAKVLAKQRRST